MSSSAAPTGHPSAMGLERGQEIPRLTGVPLTGSLCLCALCRDQDHSHTPLACAYRHLHNFNKLATSVR